MGSNRLYCSKQDCVNRWRCPMLLSSLEVNYYNKYLKKSLRGHPTPLMICISILKPSPALQGLEDTEAYPPCQSPASSLEFQLTQGLLQTAAEQPVHGFVLVHPQAPWAFSLGLSVPSVFRRVSKRCHERFDKRSFEVLRADPGRHLRCVISV